MSQTIDGKPWPARMIDGIKAQITEIFARLLGYGTCATAAATATKVGTLTGFVRSTGSRITLKFTYANTAANPTLNVNSTGAAAIVFRGTAIVSNMIVAGMLAEFVFDGTNWELLNPMGTAATATVNGVAGLIALAASNDTTSLDKGATPGGVAAQLAAQVATGITGAKGFKVYSASGTYTAASNVTAILAILTGGGGSGRWHIQGYSYIGQGGAAGGTAIRFYAVTPGQTIAYTIGAGGPALPVGSFVNGTNGNAGGASTFNTASNPLTANGGAGGTGDTAFNNVPLFGGVAGGSASGGQINITGSYADGSSGGDSFWGAGGRVRKNTAGLAGQFGAGGAAAGGDALATGAGGAGILVIIEF